jgi:hypothetical protein
LLQITSMGQPVSSVGEAACITPVDHAISSGCADTLVYTPHIDSAHTSHNSSKAMPLVAKLCQCLTPPSPHPSPPSASSHTQLTQRLGSSQVMPLDVEVAQQRIKTSFPPPPRMSHRS